MNEEEKNCNDWLEDEDCYGTRRVPIGDYLKLKKNSLLLYIYLQKMSKWNQSEIHRYIKLKELDKPKIAKDLKMGLTSIYRKLDSLEKLGLVFYLDKTNKKGEIEKYLILPQVGDYYTLVDVKLSFVKAILRQCNETLLRVFLFHKSNGMYGDEYYPTLEYIAKCIGASPTHLQKIIDCNSILEGFEVIRIRKEYYKGENGLTQKNYYTYLKAEREKLK